MLPSRLSRNTISSPSFRSFMAPRATLQSSTIVRHHLHLRPFPKTSILPRSALRATFSTTSCRVNAVKTPADGAQIEPSNSAQTSSPPATTSSSNSVMETLEPRLSITFTCTVADCGERSTHQFTKRAYERGLVLVECPGCKNRHLIADHLGWFKDDTENGKLRTVEDILRAKGEKVRRGRLDAGGVIEYTE